LADLQPYVCTFPDCELREYFFESRDDWFQHELQQHRYEWFCNDERHDSFHGVYGFFEHMEKAHQTSLDKSQIQTLERSFQRPLRSQSGDCSLCGKHSTELKHHLSRHLEQLSLFAIPQTDYMVHDNAFDVVQAADHVSTLSHKANHPYIADLGFPDHWEGSNASGLSEISDAGDQQYERQKKKTSDNEDSKSQALITDQDQQLSLFALPQTDYMVHDNAFDVVQAADHVSTLSHKANHPYIADLGFPDHWEGSNASGLSGISDAGDQQYERQKKKKTSDNEDSKSQALITDQSQQLFSTFNPRYDLQSEIYDALVQTRNPQVTHPNYGFLPKANVYCLVNEESVFRELTKDLTRASPIHTVQLMRKYATVVCNETEVWRNGKLKIKSFRKMFAILVLAEMSSSISEFIEEDISDLDLPLYRIEGTMWQKYQDASENIRKKPLKCFNHETWSPTKLRNFETYQWTMLAPFFSQGSCGDVKHYLFQDQHILPFISPQEPEDEDIEYLGGYGKVFMVRIHPDHHNFQDQKLCKRGFAIKQLYESDRKAFQKEVNILKNFSGERGHLHIVSLLATYEQFKKYHLIFYRADGNLFQFWQQIEFQPQVKHTSILWLAKQCAGIADGLSKLHKCPRFGNTSCIDTEDDLTRKSTSERHARIVTPPPQRERYDVPPRGENEQPNSPTWASFAHRRTSELPQVEQYGRHGDINPGNLLWYDDPHGEPSTLNGTLKITDFGQAELNSQFSRSGKRSVANTMTYRPPECDLQPKIIRQSYDIWCLGCVYLEFVTWILGGQSLLKKFCRKRLSPDIFLSNNKTDTFFQHVVNEDNGHTEVMIKPAVTKVSIPCHTTCPREPQLTQFSVHQRTPSTP
jgi:hypothetical protein